MLDPGNKKAWKELYSPTNAGLILRAITTEFKFVWQARPIAFPTAWTNEQ